MRILPSDSPYKNEPFFFGIAFPLSCAKGEEQLPLRSPPAVNAPSRFCPGGNYCKSPRAKYTREGRLIFSGQRGRNVPPSAPRNSGFPFFPRGK